MKIKLLIAITTINLMLSVATVGAVVKPTTQPPTKTIETTKHPSNLPPNLEEIIKIEE